MHKFKFNPKFINIINESIDITNYNKKIYIKKLNIDNYYTINYIINVIINISIKLDKLFTLPTDLLKYLKYSNKNVHYNTFNLREINEMINYEIVSREITNKFSNTYITIDNKNNKCNFYKFTVHL